MFIRLKIIEATMDLTLAKTIEGLSSYSKKINPDLIVVHGDRDAMVLL
jgi:UDP-N-acetylglucosamine 2-epimerase (hydrolysing)